MIKDNYQNPKKGMNRNSHPSEVKKEEYPFALNANVQDPTGDGDFVLTNEPSNIKCSSLKSGYVVLKHKYDRVRDRIYLFLYNPETNCSEIGYISSKEDFDLNQVEEILCNCEPHAVLDTQLQDIFQEDRCIYNTLLSDFCEELGECTGCLNFSTKHPILDVTIRYSVLGDEIYWNDGENPDRFLKLYDLENYFQDVDECEGTITPTCLQCDKLRIFKLFDRPCLLPVRVEDGGALKAGVYTVFAVYSDLDGTELSDYFTGSNPISVFDKNNTIIDQTQLDYNTNKSIRVEFTNLDPSFDYYKIVIGVSTGNDPEWIYKPYGVFPIDQDSVAISQIPSSPESNSTEAESGSNINAFDLLDVRPSYLNSRIMSNINGYLFLGNLEARREINLQPVVNLMGSLVRWRSSVAKERLYEYGESSAKFKGYNRDEVYPFGIVYTMVGGHRTALFPLIPRPAFDSEVDLMPEDVNKESITNNIDDCSDTTRDKVWQYLNTAQDIGEVLCETAHGGSSEEVEVTKQFECITETTVEVEDGQISFDVEPSLLSWINSHKDEILASSDPELAEIKDALDLDLYGNCTPDIGENCGEPTLISEEVNAIQIINERLEDVSIPADEYDPALPPASCNRLEEPLTNDTAIETIIGGGATVYQKNPNTNTSCSSAIPLSDFSGTGGVGYHLVDMGTTGSSSDLYDSSIPVTLVDDDFKPFLHNNAVWFRVLFFNNTGTIIANLSNVVCDLADDNTNNKVRVTVFDGCPTSTEIPAYGTIIADVTAVGDPNMFIELDSDDFTGTVKSAYIAIDSPMKSEMTVDLTFTGTSGSGEVIITSGVSVNVLTTTFNSDINTTASDFLTSNAVILASLGISGSVAGNVVTLVMDENEYNSLTYNQTSPDLTVTFSLVSQKHLLQPPCGCFAFYRRIPITETVTKYDSIIFAKTQVYEATCTYFKVKISDCEVSPYREGLFSHWESGLKYPCNPELFDSSDLVINQSRIPVEYQTEFEDYYVDAISGGGEYTLSSDTNFMDKNIRHYKFPDGSVSPFMQANTDDPFDSLLTNSFISPIGFTLDNDVINAFLDIAVDNNLLTQEERDSITGYELYRGNRVTERSIIAKGLLFDMLSYENSKSDHPVQYYSNYPLNDQSSTDDLNGSESITKTDGNFFTFHSPEVHFYKPTLPFEMGIEGYQFGVSVNKFSPVKDHTEQVLLGKRARNLASVIAATELAFELLTTVGELTTLGATGSGVTIGVGIATALVYGTLIITTGQYRFGSYKYEWLQTFENLGNPFNHAYYGVAQGIYKSFLPNTTSNSKIRGLDISTYLKDGRKIVSNESMDENFYINNYKREDSVLLHTDEAYKINYPSEHSNGDNSRFNIPTSESGVLGDYIKKTSSPYVSVKRYLPNQYGGINSIEWISTRYCGRLDEDNSCDIVFGGDIFISRFALKRKFPFFTDVFIGLAPNVPFKYSNRFNIDTGVTPDSRGYLDFKTSNDNMNSGIFVLPENISEYTLWDGATWTSEVNKFYVTDEYKFLVYYYGFPYFLVESEVNCNYRYAKIEMKEDFYPNLGDVIDYTQEVNVPISEPNTYFYNYIYSRLPHKSAYRLLPINFSKDTYDKINDLSNAVISSDQDNLDSSRLRSPWLNYRAANFHRFNRAYGDLVDLQGIESQMLWARFTDGYEILNAIDTLAERVTPQTRKTGMSGVFQNRALNFNVTDLGYSGTQHRETISTEFGHYSVDAKRGKVFELQPGARGTSEISVSMDKWFKEQLPFKILKKFPNANVDDIYNGIGIAMGWDDRTKRLLITKRDYIPIDNNLLWAEDIGFYIEGLEEERIEIKYTDEKYFEPAHWTVGYSPITKTWISYYSFHPFYYITLNDHFKTGINQLGDYKHGIWSHYPLISSYQVFYGDFYPFIVEYVSGTSGSNSTIDSINYILDVRKYYNKYDFSNVFGKGFNKAYIYNNLQNSGELRLKFSKGDNPRDLIDYPKYFTNHIETLQSEEDGIWGFNYLFDHVRDIRAQLPVWLNDNVDILKELNPSSIQYKNNRKDRLRGDYFITRLIQDEDSRNKLVFRFSRDLRNYYQ